MKVALVIGHNPRGQGSYSSHLENSEYEFWKEVSNTINILNDSIDIYCREAKTNYIEEMKPVIKEINNHDYDYCIELHFNAHDNENAKGCECLVHKNSKRGKEIALSFLEKFNIKFNIPIRQKNTKGLIEVENSKIRGAYGICNTKPPYVLIEPFFGTNIEALEFKDSRVMARFIVDFIMGFKFKEEKNERNFK